MPSRRYIVTAPGDMASALKSGLNITDLRYKISEQGGLMRSARQVLPVPGALLGISDAGLSRIPDDTGNLCRDIYYELQGRHLSGVLLDFEESRAELYPFVSKLSHGLQSRDIVHFVPVRFHSAAPGAIVLVEAAVSGGTFDEMVTAAAERYGAKRLAFDLLPVRSDFMLPSFNSEGTRLNRDELKALLSGMNPSVFFSAELIAKYFSYQDKEGGFHFVLFDDKTTMDEKIHRLETLGEYPVFMLYSDWKDIYT